MQAVAINLLWVSPRDPTGAFIYVKNLLDHIFRLDRETTFILITRLRDYRYFSSWYGNYPNAKVCVSDLRNGWWRQPLRAIRKIWYKWQGQETKIEQLVAKELVALAARRGITKMFFPTQMVYPKGLNGIEHYVTILDLQHEYLPNNFSSTELNFRRDNLNYICRIAHHLFAISKYTKKTLIEKYALPPAKITVTPLAPHQTNIHSRSIKLPEKYIYYPAAVWPHKNHRLVIEALHKLNHNHPDLHVVFSGLIKNASLKQELDQLVNQYQLTGRVHFFGLVSDEVLEYLYQHATLMVFPSSFEGFGMPILEAYQHNLPVVAARNTSIIEVAGEGALLFKTNNLRAFVAAIDKILSDAKMKESFRIKMKEQLARFSWRETAQKTLNQLLDV